MFKVFITAGEASGDVLGARLMRALRAQRDDIVFDGVGGAMMQEEGLRSLFPMTDLSVMGVAEILPRLPLILRRIRETAQAIISRKPDIVITIDAPDFSFRVARAVKAHSAQTENEILPKMVHYVAPTVWAWRPERARKVAGLYDGILCLLPFEPPYFTREGMRAAFVGHAMMESGLRGGDGAAFRRRYNIPAGATVLGVMFGSRMGELNRMGPVLRAAALQIAKEYPELHIVSPTLPHLEREALNFLQKMPCAIHMTADKAEKNDAFASMDFAVATSGTVGLELAVADVPHIIGYRISKLTAKIVRRKLTTKYAHLANILLDREAVPEFIQENCVAAGMAESLRMLKNDPAFPTRQKKHFEQVRTLIAGPDGWAPSQRAASFVLDICEQSSD